MMRFSPRLTVDLLKALITQKIPGTEKHPLVLRLNPAEFSAQREFASESPDVASSSASESDPLYTQMLSLVHGSSAPVVWIGGETPLQFPRIGQLTREIVDSGRTVFIETDGRLLRRRIHEFRPVSRLYVTVQLNGLEASHDRRAGTAGIFRVTIEGVRAAKLSGFHICVLTTMFADTEMEELRRLKEYISKMNVDGWVQAQPVAGEREALSNDELLLARHLIPSWRWRKLSELLDRAADTPVPQFAKAKYAQLAEEELRESSEGMRVR
jgi:sulfatase maturation enzyme AslB (radical SAM superfamily)